MKTEMYNKSIRINLTAEQNAALDSYLDKNGLKLGGLTRMLLLRELVEKSALKTKDYEPPKAIELQIKTRRK